MAKVAGGERYTIVQDYLGTPTQAYDSKGNLIWELLLDVYGEVKEYHGDRTFVPFRYQGQYEDEGTGLCYNRFRYFDYNTGIFISQDPLGFVGNNPTLYGYVYDLNTQIDPFGLSIFDFLKTGGLSFNDYKTVRGGTKTLAFIETINESGAKVLQRISIEYHHVFISQRLQRKYHLPNWLVNNRINVWKLNTIQHAILDQCRFKFLRKGLKKDVGWFKKYNFFTNFKRTNSCS